MIRHQSLTTGLFPKYSDGEPIGHVEETLYCAIAIWSLRQCYSKVDTDQGRTYHLGQIAVKSMRGILFCWMKQAEKLEKFKSDSFPKNALHSKFSIVTGLKLWSFTNKCDFVIFDYTCSNDHVKFANNLFN